MYAILFFLNKLENKYVIISRMLYIYICIHVHNYVFMCDFIIL
jgi:hypothetical protein